MKLSKTLEFYLSWSVKIAVVAPTFLKKDKFSKIKNYLC
ncbi:hypothetical protein LEP1GSC059_1551 [Leptospira noguchii serovar Panama str. CZ214]|uniref:Uncharacterized protein n=1 Tax=Leptospira noguchii serovar Panama str. CZ214 TaxID=1001595 RepID=T0FRZ4_9LEPT|nr:hypothetical protein LEP1GSC059_1551 [Leptospira noguchii serovar Panama str. CZ214]